MSRVLGVTELWFLASSAVVLVLLLPPLRSAILVLQQPGAGGEGGMSHDVQV